MGTSSYSVYTSFRLGIYRDITIDVMWEINHLKCAVRNSCRGYIIMHIIFLCCYTDESSDREPLKRKSKMEIERLESMIYGFSEKCSTQSNTGDLGISANLDNKRAIYSPEKKGHIE
ncbi:hypothetical protein RCL_jg2566.t1 [Rhizophagus clarus]|uniref:Uncharacterized protein n=1 Tax=Rhizophagus clarus TaxID=94130 RepID=A0A8H3LMG5_9GLOM|nr:hypothetical protein RCL_jg2566.t1 [Rhizophagus clarus]